MNKINKVQSILYNMVLSPNDLKPAYIQLIAGNRGITLTYKEAKQVISNLILTY